MDFLSKGYSVLVGDRGQEQSPAETIQRLADRAAHATLMEDRRAAVLSLKGLSREYKADVGHAALDALLTLLDQDKEDPGIVKPILETLHSLCTRDPRDEPSTLGAEFSAKVLEDQTNVEALLDIMVQTDFYVRFNAVQLLGTLLASHPTPLQDAILVLPLGVGRLMDLLDDHRDIIRNEALLLLITLTQDHDDIQKIVAFQGAFDRLLDIMTAEGGIRGGIIVQDCIQLLHNLLRYNVSNQNFFRETSCIQRLPTLLSTEVDNANTQPYEEEESFVWSEQAAANAAYLLDMVRLLIVPGNLNTKANQDAIYQCDMFAPLVQLSLAPDTPSAVKVQALYSLGDIVRANHTNQDVFMRITITVVPDNGPEGDTKLIPEPVIVSIVNIAVGTNSPGSAVPTPYAVRSAATYLCLSYIYDNPDTQLTLVSTLTPPPSDNPNSVLCGSARSAGSLLIEALLPGEAIAAENPFRTWYAAVILGHLLAGHPTCKQLALKVTFGEPERGEDPVSLMQELTQALIHAVEKKLDSRVAIGLLTLLCRWLNDSPASVAQFLEESTNVHFLIEEVTKASGTNCDPIVQGLLALLLTLIYQYNDEPGGGLSRHDLQPILHQRIGIDTIRNRLNRMRDAKPFQDPSFSLKPMAFHPTTHLPELYFDQSFVDFVRSNIDGWQRTLSTPPAQVALARSPQLAAKPSTSIADMISTNNDGASAGTGAVVDAEEHRAAIAALEQTVQSQLAEIQALTMQMQSMAVAPVDAETTNAQAKEVSTTNDDASSSTAWVAKVAELEQQLREQQEKMAALEKEQEDLLVYLVEQDTQCKQYRARLRELGDDIPLSDNDDEGADGVEEEAGDDDNSNDADTTSVAVAMEPEPVSTPSPKVTPNHFV
ncbi:Vesicle-mediated ER to Golgi transport protein [Dimargaris xerosporica]|nr:Vesicle-mediated ER to Golgi transport protein [Dimargaris xerosporica]